MKGRVLIVAGSDSGGGAGIQADIKTVTALQGHATTAISALTAQNTLGVSAVLPIEPDFVAQQMHAVLDDIGTDAVKTGMLHNAEVIHTVSKVLREKAPDVPTVVDPVMYSQSGHSLLEDEAIMTLTRDLCILADLITPNIPEAKRLTGMEIETLEDMKHAAQMLMTIGAKAVLLKGGHADHDTLTDILVTEDGMKLFQDKRLDVTENHGTGCTLASAIAVGLGQGLTMRDAVVRARAYLRKALLAAPNLGQGAGPVGHGHTVQEFKA